MSKKKRQAITLCVLLLILIAAAVGYQVISQRADKKQKEEEASTEEKTVSIYDLSVDDIQKIAYTIDEETVTLILEDGIWVKDGDKDFPLSQDLVNTMANTFSGMNATKMVTEEAEDLGEFGLDKPVLSIDVTMKDGTINNLKLGLEYTMESGYYACTSAEKNVFIVAESIYSAFDYTGNQLVDMDTPPSITADYVTRLAVDAKKGEDFEAVYDEEKSESKDIYGWDIKKPFADTVAGDVYTLRELYGNYASLSFSECVDYTGKNLKKYGLEKPSYTIDIDYYEVVEQEDESKESENAEDAKEEHIDYSYQLLIGNKDDSGENYYVKSGESDMVCLMSSTTVEGLVVLNAMDYVYKNCYLGSVQTLDTIDMTYDGKDYHMVLTREENASKGDEAEKETDEKDSTKEGVETEGSDDVTYTATINGEAVDEADFRMAYGAIAKVSYTGQINKEKVPEDDTPYVMLRYREGERDTTIKFLPYDGVNFYRVNLNGTELFLVDKQAIESVVKGFLDLMK